MPLHQQLLVHWAHSVEKVMAFHMNPRKQRLAWASAEFSWDSCTDDGPGDIAKRSRMCAEAVMGALQVADKSYSFHYACDKGFAGLLLVVGDN